jgi:flagellar biosynthetic protein FlhB
MAEQDLNRNEAATPYKLERAREKGQAAKSADVVSAVVFAVAVVYLYWKGWDGLRAQFQYDRALLTHAGRIIATPANLWSLVGGMVRDTMVMLADFLGVMVIAAVLANVAQTGPMLSLEPLKPDFSRTNPVAGLKKLFSMRTLFEGLRAVLKLAALTLVVYYALKSLTHQFFHLAALPAPVLARTMVEDVAATGLKIALVLGLIAMLDLGFTRWQFAKQMRMSRREMTDEHKNREGDPRIKARIRELRREMLKRSQALHRTGEADVLITNPTHVAVALRYVHGQMDSPQLVAKGAGALAAVMRQIAARRGVPVVQNPPLARALFNGLGVDQHVTADHFAQVARILVWVFAMREARDGGGKPA